MFPLLGGDYNNNIKISSEGKKGISNDNFSCNVAGRSDIRIIKIIPHVE